MTIQERIKSSLSRNSKELNRLAREMVFSPCPVSKRVILARIKEKEDERKDLQRTLVLFQA